MIKQESNNNPQAIGPQTKYGTAKGLMQLMDATGKEWHQRLQIKEPYDPFNKEQNYKIGTAYINHLLKKYNGDEKLALMAYNWGPGNVSKWLNGEVNKIPEETTKYVKKILGVDIQ